MPKRSGSFLALSLALLVSLATPVLSQRVAESAGHEPRSVGAVVSEAERAGIRTGVAVFDANGRRLHAFRAEEAFIPASNQKLITAVAFLQAFGRNFQFETGFQVADGELIVRAGADPNWRSGTEYDPSALFERVARELLKERHNRIRGVRIDLGSYTGPRRGTSWPEGQLDRSYCAPSGALSLDGSRYAVQVRRGGGQYNATVQVLQPSSGAPMIGSIQFGGGAPGVRLRDGHFELSGSIGRNAGTKNLRGNVEEPEALFSASLQTAFRSNGVRLDPNAPRFDAELRSVRTSARPTLERILRESNNFDAEQCFRRLGAELGDGSYSGAARAVEEHLRDLGVEVPRSAFLADGSGLSRDNQLTPDLVCEVLHRASTTDFASELLDLLPHPGMRDSTLERRFEGRLDRGLRAKTGTIRGVSALSGFVETGNGRYAFSILMEGAGSSTMRRFQERIVQAIRREAS
ncbi:MAG: D-alanyl-D-alanine carboxypeptidase/D-alanyl-D-alanine-endopeptidase [Planctomycetota bacterium]